jgi:hypothetical protein
MAEHTPGPWQTVTPMHGHPTEYLCVQLGADEKYSTLEMLPADAKLVAAAPDLLYALELILAEPFGCPFCDSGKLRKPKDPAKGHTDDCGFDVARRAIAKAHGS